MTPFEKLLSETPLPEIPLHWREEILAAAENQPGKTPALLAFWVFFRGLLWPHPAAWAALAACWLVVGALCVSAPRQEQLAVTPPGIKPASVSPESYAAYLKLRDRLIEQATNSETPVLNRRDL